MAKIDRGKLRELTTSTELPELLVNWSRRALLLMDAAGAVVAVNEAGEKRLGQLREAAAEVIRRYGRLPEGEGFTAAGVQVIHLCGSDGTLLGVCATTEPVPGAAKEAEAYVLRRVDHELQTIQALAAAIAARSGYTRYHCEKVADMTAGVVARMGYDLSRVQLAHLGGTLHDIGKIGVPEAILDKPGPLTGEEWAIVKRHPVIGAEILSHVESFQTIVLVIRHHHERWDGKGYPDGLAGEKIPLLSRVIAVADAFDAITSDRSYRPRRSVPEALAEIERCAGTQFDPRVVQVFLALMREEGWEIEN
ncbi:MAG: HD-GYP domain-containing protein [Desulfotomaculales bacterium]